MSTYWYEYKIEDVAVDMASKAGAPEWLNGIVKGVPSGDSLVIMKKTKSGIPPERTITLSSIMAPKLGSNRGGVDEPFAWNSTLYLRKLCLGKEVVFKVDDTAPIIRREFGTVFLGDKNVAVLVVAAGWAKVKEQGQHKRVTNPFLPELLSLEEQAKEQGLGRWSKEPGASEASIRNLPPSSIRDSSSFDALALMEKYKSTPLKAVVDMVTGGSTLHVYLLPEFQYAQVLVAGVQAPGSGRNHMHARFIGIDTTSNGQSGDSTSEASAPLTTAQRVASSSASMFEFHSEPYGLEAKHFTETRVLHREVNLDEIYFNDFFGSQVRIVLEGVDKRGSLIGSVYYADGESANDLALELVENGLAKYVEWSASLLEDDVKCKLKNAELEAKKACVRMWTNFVPPVTNSKAIHDQKFTGKVIEVVSGDCIIVADDTAERRVNLSSIRCPKMGNPRRNQNPEPYARDAKELLRTRLIGNKVNVFMEYSRKIGSSSAVMDFGSVFRVNQSKDGDVPAPKEGNQQDKTNIAELLRSNYYDALLSAESHAISKKKGIHSTKEPPIRHVTDLVMTSAKKAKDFLPYLQRNGRMSGVVEYLFSGHRYKIDIPKETCSVAFSLSGVRCPGRGEPYSNEAIAFMRRIIIQRDLFVISISVAHLSCNQIEVETVDRTGTFLGTLWESKTNVAVLLLEAGLAKLHTSFGLDRIPDAHLLVKAEQSAKQKKLKIWENYVEKEEVSNGTVVEKRQRKKEELKVVVTEVLGGGKFYVQLVGDRKMDSLHNQIASLTIQEPPEIGAFNPKKSDIVLAQFSEDNSWNRAMIVNAPRGAVESTNDKYEIFYVDYGTQETVPYSQLRPLDPCISSGPGLAQLCSLAYIKVPNLKEDYGREAATRLSEHLSTSKEFKAVIEEKDSSGGKVKGQGTGTMFMVTLFDSEAEEDEISVNACMLKLVDLLTIIEFLDSQEGLARVEKRRRRRREAEDRQRVLEELEEYELEAREERQGMWEYGDIASDDEEKAHPNPTRKKS
ncbi:hypothetical protein ACJIZ3_004364 [Penstemon smallii]|uniref:Ribonuclease n=1 Tax=Penstemon smallii TaxID=265156 RepID=A0ABD3S1U7_9LAMI